MNKVQIIFDEFYRCSYPTDCDFRDMIANMDDEPSMNSLVSELEEDLKED